MDQLISFYMIYKSAGRIGTGGYKNRTVFTQGLIGQKTSRQGIISVQIHQDYFEQIHVGIPQQLMYSLTEGSVVRQFEKNLPFDPVGPHLSRFRADKKSYQKAEKDDKDKSEKIYQDRKAEGFISIGQPQEGFRNPRYGIKQESDKEIK